MTKDIYRYSFEPSVPLEEIEMTLLLALWCVESLHGESQVRLDASHLLDRARRVCVIDADSTVGLDVNRLFVGLLRREFGEDSFSVERLHRPRPEPQEARK